MMKTEAKEEGTKLKHISVVYSDKRKNLCMISSVVLAVLLFVVLVGYIAVQPRVPRFVLDDLYVDSVSNSSVMVKLSSKNPSSKSSVYYSKIRMHVRVDGNFETEKVFLANTFQKPDSVLIWTAAVATNSDNARVSGSFQMRDGVKKGDVISHLLIQWKSGFFWSAKHSLNVTCPVLLNLKDLTSTVSKPMSSCSTRFT